MHSLHKDRSNIAHKVRDLRRSRKWTQAELAERLEISQSRLSEVERGAGSFSAEQFLRILKLFNVSLAYFSADEPRGGGLQNALIRHGATNLQQDREASPDPRYDDINVVVRDALLDGSPRLITGLAPLLVLHTDRIALAKLHADLRAIGKERRLAWVADNTLLALAAFLPGASRNWQMIGRRAELVLREYLRFIGAHASTIAEPSDLLDATIRSARSRAQVESSASTPSRRHGIVTGLQPSDFERVLNDLEPPQAGIWR